MNSEIVTTPKHHEVWNLAQLDAVSSYTTLSQVIDRYDLPRETIDLLDGNGAYGALKATDALIDDELTNRYELPLEHAMVLLSNIACSIAAYELGFHSVREQIEKDYSGALDTQQLLSEGTIRLSCDEYKYYVPIDPPGFKHNGAS